MTDPAGDPGSWVDLLATAPEPGEAEYGEAEYGEEPLADPATLLDNSIEHDLGTVEHHVGAVDDDGGDLDDQFGSGQDPADGLDEMTDPPVDQPLDPHGDQPVDDPGVTVHMGAIDDGGDHLLPEAADGSEVADGDLDDEDDDDDEPDLDG